MSIAIKINSGDDEPFAVDIEQFPTKIMLAGQGLGLSLIPFAFFLLVASFFVLGLGIALMLGAALVAFLAYALWRGGRQNSLVFERTHVVVTEVGLFKDNVWEVPYKEFKGVYMRKRRAKSGSSRTTYQIIELKHPDDEKTLPLFVDKTRKTPTERWQNYAKLFDIPPLREET